MTDAELAEHELEKRYLYKSVAEEQWERETCPRVYVEQHDDNTELQCRNWGSTLWTWLDHDACDQCNLIMGETMVRADIMMWRIERARRTAAL